MTASDRRRIALAILVAALGYFVDIYDLILFSIVRVKSLESLGVQGKDGKDLLDDGVLLLNMQMGGMLVGGVLWGILGDRRGRLSVLFGSIFLYSLANLANGLVQTVPQYAVLRFIAGLGLAGELGAGITLVSELMPKRARGYGTTIVATIGILGGVLAVSVGDLSGWRAAYFIGGALGLGLLLLRLGVAESSLFDQVKMAPVSRGDFFSLFDRTRIRKYLAVIAVGLPVWYVAAILVTFSREIGSAMGMSEVPRPEKTVLFDYLGISAGSLLSGSLSQLLKSRKKVLLGFHLLTAVFVILYFTVAKSSSLVSFYAVCSCLGVATGYWAVFVAVAAEQFGTNIRATVTTTVPNFVRGAVVPITIAFQAGEGASRRHRERALAIGAVCLVLAMVAVGALEGRRTGRTSITSSEDRSPRRRARSRPRRGRARAPSRA